METVDVVVVGSGIGSLCCATLLARLLEEIILQSHPQGQSK